MRRAHTDVSKKCEVCLVHSYQGSNSYQRVATCIVCAYQEKTPIVVEPTTAQDCCPHTDIIHSGSSSKRKVTVCRQCGQVWHEDREVYTQYEDAARRLKTRSPELKQAVLKLVQDEKFGQADAKRAIILFQKLATRHIESHAESDEVPHADLVTILQDSIDIVMVERVK